MKYDNEKISFIPSIKMLSTIFVCFSLTQYSIVNREKECIAYAYMSKFDQNTGRNCLLLFYH
jgi:hypothetical protein